MLLRGKDAISDAAYERHRPEQTLLYQLIEKHYPALIEQFDAQGKGRGKCVSSFIWFELLFWAVMSRFRIGSE